MPHVELETISVAHFPVRSREQYNRKIDFFNNIDRTGLNEDQITQYKNQSYVDTVDELKDRAINYRGIIEGQQVIEDPVI